MVQDMREIRERKEMSINKVASRSGISIATLIQYEKGAQEIPARDLARLAKIAAYYTVPLEKLEYHRERYRKALSAYLHQAMKAETAVQVELCTGETLTGQVRWWDLGAFGLDPEDSGPLTVVQRHAVLDWEEVGSAPGDE